MNRILSLCIVGCVLVLGCSTEPEPAAPVEAEVEFAEWQAIEPGQLSEEQKAQHELCLSATNSMASELMGELVASLDGENPAEAIGICSEKAPKIAVQIAEDFGVKIGRTSHKLRNPKNVPPPWGLKVVAWGKDEPAYFVGPEGEFGALLPIRLKAECMICHGPAEDFDPEIRRFIDEIYPEDQATDFADGDLRGWFWIEAPAKPSV